LFPCWTNIRLENASAYLRNSSTFSIYLAAAVLGYPDGLENHGYSLTDVAINKQVPKLIPGSSKSFLDMVREILDKIRVKIN